MLLVQKNEKVSGTCQLSFLRSLPCPEKPFQEGSLKPLSQAALRSHRSLSHKDRFSGDANRPTSGLGNRFPDLGELLSNSGWPLVPCVVRVQKWESGGPPASFQPRTLIVHVDLESITVPFDHEQTGQGYGVCPISERSTIRAYNAIPFFEASMVGGTPLKKPGQLEPLTRPSVVRNHTQRIVAKSRFQGGKPVGSRLFDRKAAG